MKIKLLNCEKKNGKLSFLIQNTTPAFANLLRRAIIGRVQTMAIEDVEFKDNDSILYDEMIAHRLGMLPLTTDLKSYNLKEGCKCKEEGCARCQTTLTLKEKGPKMIYASDLKSKDPKIKPVFPKTPIVKLLKDQKLELIATAILGVGVEHIKWSPGSAWYSYNPNVTIKSDAKLMEKFKDKFPKKAIKNGKLDKQKIIDNNLYDACDGICENLVKIDWEENNIQFYLESWGQLSPKDMVKKACEEINVRIEDFVDTLKKA